MSSQEERLFILNVLGLASSPTDASKCLAMAQLVRIAQDVAQKRTWKELEQHDPHYPEEAESIPSEGQTWAISDNRTARV